MMINFRKNIIKIDNHLKINIYVLSEMPNYQNGKIYKITNSVNNDTYIGSTTQKLCARMRLHRMSAKKSKAKVYCKMRSIGIQNFKIELLEDFPCYSKKELLHQEEYWRKLLKASLNSRVCTSGLTKKQYNKNYHQHYYNSHKYHTANTKYRTSKKFKMVRQKYNKRYIAIKIVCPVCCSLVQKCKISVHNKSKMHTKLLAMKEQRKQNIATFYEICQKIDDIIASM